MRHWSGFWAVLLLFVALPNPAWSADLRLAVAEFDNAADTDEFDALGKGLQSMITTDLAAVEALTLVERARLQELLDEMELGAQGVLDPSTAAEVGKVVGATHVVAGTFTVVGDRMRLDARLVDVTSGEVTTAAEAEGERDAFFELEKDLVKALLAALEADPSPKERAAIARIHTADFDSFREYSTGVALYDADRYEEALATLERVAARDEDFKLARRTLDEYEELIASVREKARAIEVAEAELRFRATQEAAAREAEIVESLYAIADDPGSTLEERMGAHFLLAVGLGTGHAYTERFGVLADSADEFAMRRSGDRAAQAFWRDVRPVYPKYSFSLNDGILGSWFLDDRSFEENWKRQYSSLYTRGKYDLNGCYSARLIDEELREALWMDRKQATDASLALLEDAPECWKGEGSRQWVDAMQAIAEDYRDLHLVDRSTHLLERAAAATQDTRELARIEDQLEEDRTATEVLSDPRLDELGRELLLYNPRFYGSVDSAFRSTAMKRFLEGGDKALWEVHRIVRTWGRERREPMLFIGELPVWKLEGAKLHVATDRRVSLLRAGAIRYYGDDQPHVDRWGTQPPGPIEPAFFVVGGVPREDVRLSVDVDHRIADDFFPGTRAAPGDEEPWEYSTARPKVAVLLGMTDIYTAAECDPVSDEVTASVPLKALAVIVEGSTATVAHIREVDDLSELRCEYPREPVDAWEIDRVVDTVKVGGGDHYGLEVSLAGTTLKIKAGGPVRKVELAEAPRGFVGLLTDGPGYVQIGDLEWE